MKPYKIEIEGKSLDEITAAVAGEEVGASEFVRSAIRSSGGKKKNIGTFNELPAGTQPKEIVFVAGTTAPDGTEIVWTGRMLVNGAEDTVSACRKS